MSAEIKRHPLAIAWDEWIATKEGQECRQANTLAHNTNQYLENRLNRAFMAGAKVGEPVIEAAQKWRHAFAAEDAPRYPSIEAEDLDDQTQAALSQAVDTYERDSQ